ncbi:hypothetical protein PENTCL1PPCAC_15008, partial [Pristionchus entomophagus]
MEEKLRIADQFDELILNGSIFFRLNDPVAMILKIFSKRCSHLQLESVNLNEEQVNQLIRELPALAKKVYLYALIGRRLGDR